MSIPTPATPGRSKAPTSVAPQGTRPQPPPPTPRAAPAPGSFDYTNLPKDATHAKMRGFITAANIQERTVTALLSDWGKFTKSRTLRDQIRSALATYKARTDVVLDGYYHLMQVDGPQYKIYVDKADEWSTKYAKHLSDVNGALADYEQEMHELEVTLARTRAQNGSGGGSSAASFASADDTFREYKKIHEGLKPQRLTKTATPAEFAAWKRGFDSFYHTGNLATLRNQDQQAWLYACLDQDLQADMHTYTTEETEIFPDGTSDKSCMCILDDIFSQLHPLAACRHNFFNQGYIPGESNQSIVSRCIEAGKQAVLITMNPWDMIANQIIYCTAPDSEMQKELFQLEHPTLDSVQRVMARYTRQQAASAMVSSSAAASPSANLAAFPQRRAPARQGGTPRRNPAPTAPSSMPASDACRRCGTKGHRSDKCPKKFEDTYCGHCKLQGHTFQACRSRHLGIRPKAAVNGLSENVHAMTLGGISDTGRPTPPVTL